MVVGVAITNLDYTAADLRQLMSKERDGEVVRRLSALALVLEGHSCQIACNRDPPFACNVDPLGVSDVNPAL